MGLLAAAFALSSAVFAPVGGAFGMSKTSTNTLLPNSSSSSSAYHGSGYRDDDDIPGEGHWPENKDDYLLLCHANNNNASASIGSGSGGGGAVGSVCTGHTHARTHTRTHHGTTFERARGHCCVLCMLYYGREIKHQDGFLSGQHTPHWCLPCILT